MIQELFGVSGLLAAAGDAKISINGSILNSSSLSAASSAALTTTSSVATVSVAATTTTTTSNSEGQNLRCPRCHSSNTKFCYYNNYNLTQPRHFCKTCHRYWTKGGVLRNVPIGGGCRKNKSAAAGRVKTASSEKLGRVGLDHDIVSSPSQILWGSPQNSHLLAIVRSAAQNQNPSPNNLAGSQLINHPPPVPAATTPFHARTMGFDPVNCSSYWRNNPSQVIHQQNGYVHGGGCSGIQELYQKLKTASSSYFTDGLQGSRAVGGVGTAAMTTAPVGGGKTTGYWNPAFSWSDVHASANEAYP